MFRYFFPILALIGQLAASPFLSCPLWLRSSIEAIEALPEAAPLLQQVEREGGVRVATQSRSDFAAFWDGASRTVIISTGHQLTEGRLISSILFELCNAGANREFSQLWRRAGRGELSREAFVRAAERIEFENLRKANALLRAGVQRNLFPWDASCWNPPNFETFLRIQKSSGHSKFLANQFANVRGRSR